MGSLFDRGMGPIGIDMLMRYQKIFPPDSH